VIVEAVRCVDARQVGGEIGRQRGDVAIRGRRGVDDAHAGRRPNFRFHAIEARNEAYESPTALSAAELSFPFPPESFDLVIVTSVFTHMLDDALDNYVSEVARVLRCGGRMFVSLFLLDDVSKAAIRAGRAKLDFRHPFGAMRALNTECPEEGLAIERADFLERLRRHAFVPHGPIHLGSWRDGSTGCGNVYLQDLLLARKTGG
jgi:SAM-dependent methyltransferase